MSNQIGKLVATIRGYRGMTQAELYRKSGVPHAYISRLENDKQVLSDEHMARIAEALGVDLDEVRPAFERFVAAVNSHAD